MSHILIIDSPYYAEINSMLVEGAKRALHGAGATWEQVSVPGAFEIPAAIRLAMNSGRYHGYVALGCVIRGETSHYDYVCGESARGINELAIQHGLAIGYGILTVDTEAQAIERANIKQGDKGGEAAKAALTLIALRERFGKR